LSPYAEPRWVVARRLIASVAIFRSNPAARFGETHHTSQAYPTADETMKWPVLHGRGCGRDYALNTNTEDFRFSADQNTLQQSVWDQRLEFIGSDTRYLSSMALGKW
jgi:hypothetical protein